MSFCGHGLLRLFWKCLILLHGYTAIVKSHLDYSHSLGWCSGALRHIFICKYSSSIVNTSPAHRLILDHVCGKSELHRPPNYLLLQSVCVQCAHLDDTITLDKGEKSMVLWQRFSKLCLCYKSVDLCSKWCDASSNSHWCHISFACPLQYFQDDLTVGVFKKTQNYKSIFWCKKAVTPLPRHWSYIFLALTHRNVPVLTEVLH